MKFRKIQLAIIGALVAIVFSPIPTAAATSGSEASSAQGICAKKISSDGRTASGFCTPATKGTQFRLALTTCGPSSCVHVKGPWWNQDSIIHSYTPGGFIASIDAIEVQ